MTIGIRLKWNLFDGFGSNERVAQGDVLLQQERIQAEETERRLKEEAYDKLLHEADHEDQLALAEKQLEYAKRRLTIDKERVETRSMSTLQYRSSELTVGDAYAG